MLTIQQIRRAENQMAMKKPLKIQSSFVMARPSLKDELQNYSCTNSYSKKCPPSKLAISLEKKKLGLHIQEEKSSNNKPLSIRMSKGAVYLLQKGQFQFWLTPSNPNLIPSPIETQPQPQPQPHSQPKPQSPLITIPQPPPEVLPSHQLPCNDAPNLLDQPKETNQSTITVNQPDLQIVQPQKSNQNLEICENLSAVDSNASIARPLKPAVAVGVGKESRKRVGQVKPKTRSHTRRIPTWLQISDEQELNQSEQLEVQLLRAAEYRHQRPQVVQKIRDIYEEVKNRKIEHLFKAEVSKHPLFPHSSHEHKRLAARVMKDLAKREVIYLN